MHVYKIKHHRNKSTIVGYLIVCMEIFISKIDLYREGVINDANSIPVTLKPNGRIEHLLTNASSELLDVKFIKPCNYF